MVNLNGYDQYHLNKTKTLDGLLLSNLLRICKITLRGVDCAYYITNLRLKLYLINNADIRCSNSQML